MEITRDDSGYSISGITKEELRGMYNMICSACLQERRAFNGLKNEITKEIDL